MQCHHHHYHHIFLTRFSLFTTKPKLNPKIYTVSMSMSMSMSSSSTPPPPSSSSVSQEEEKKSNLDQALKYHQQTKHNYTNYARGPGRLDWANQPNPFRRYISAPLINLQHFPTDEQESLNLPSLPLYSSLFTSLPAPKPISFSSISQLFYDSLALSAWKTTGFSTWSLRVNPSSGNLHPTEAYIIGPRIESLSESCFVAHYAPKEHGLEIRAEINDGVFEGFNLGGCGDCFFVGFSSIFWREGWKYGERAFRYCNHDVGHAIAAVAVAAAGLGWDVKLLDGLGHSELEKLLGVGFDPKFAVPSRAVKGKFPEVEFEHPDCVLAVFPRGRGESFVVDYKGLSERSEEFPRLDWKGKANSLSKEHIVWDVIYRTSEAVKKPLSVGERLRIDPFQSSEVCSEGSYKALAVREVVRKRRSAVDMDGATVIDRDTFYQILLHCLPSGRNGGKQGKQLALAFRALSWDSEVHAVLFVHRVSDLPKGLYFLVRNEEHFDDLRKNMRPEFTWRKPDGCPDDLPLFELAPGDCREISKTLSCHQDIAADGCFSLGMIARFEPTLRAKGAWMYPRLFWETGVLGQVLYLEAHAVGISATGIGCFFDDPVHEVLGLKKSDYQTLYHFTVGSPVVDKRIMSLPAYPGPEIDA